jgi:hypothetical protein
MRAAAASEPSYDAAMSFKRALAVASGVGLGLSALLIACADDGPSGAPDASVDAPFLEAGNPRPSHGEDEGDAPLSDAQAKDSAPPSPPDTTPPGSVGDLAGAAVTHTSVKLTWTAPPDEADAGTVAAYELRWATAPITDLTAFMAATSVTAPAPIAAGGAQTLSVSGLTAATEYHFALRARDAVGNYGAISNDAVVTTKARATFLVSEIAPLNAANEGGDFVELVATAAGSAADLEVRYSSAAASALLYKLGPIDVAVGDRVVVHAVGLPGPTGFAQEDTTNDRASSAEPAASADAYDVYSSVDNLPSTSSLVSVMDGTAYQDAVPYSSRAADASSAAMTAFADAHAAGQWTFSAAPVDGTNDCPTLLEVVNANASASTAPACGGWPGFLAAGSSLQRNGTVDTNARQDFFVAAQTRGAENAPFCAQEGAALALTEVNPKPGLVELRVTQGGSLRGFTVRRDPRDGDNGTLLATLGPICASTDDVVVLHLGAPANTPSESKSKDEQPVATNPGFYDAAWDVASTSSSSALPTATSLVIALRDPGGVYVEAAAFSNMTTTPADGGAYQLSLTFLQGRGLWLPPTCGGVTPCTTATTPTARDVAASWNGVGALAADASCGRADPASPRQASSWSVGPSTFGQ